MSNWAKYRKRGSQPTPAFNQGTEVQTFVTIPAGSTGTVAVAGVGAKTIKVSCVVVSGATSTLSCCVRLLSNATVISPWFRAAGTATFQFSHAEEEFETAVGEDLKISNPLSDDALVWLNYVQA